MPNEHGRGTTAVDSNRIRSAAFDQSGPSITVTTASQSKPFTVTFPDTRLGRQFAEAVWAQLPQAAQGGRWVSERTLHAAGRDMVRLTNVLERLGVDDVADLDLPMLRTSRDMAKLTPFTWRRMRKAVARAIEQHHPSGASLAAAVRNEMLDSTIKHHWTAYPTEIADDIEALANTSFRHWYLAQKSLLDEAGIDTTDRNWILLDADDVLEIVGPAPPSVSAATSLEGQVATAIVNGAASPDGPDAARIDAALWPTPNDLAAALTAICLADNIGDNLSTLQSLTGPSVIHSGRNTAVVQTEKARAATQISVAASTADLTTYGGLVTALVGLTRFSRRWRHQNLDFEQPHLAALAELVCMAHRATSGGHRIVQPSMTPFARQVREKTGESLVFPRLRATALKRATDRHGRDAAWVTGQSESTRRTYLRNMVPQTELAGLVVDAQDNLIQAAQAYVASHPDATEREQSLAEASPNQLVDVGVATCGNAGDDPDTGNPCGKGPVACFSCPVGYRTPANIPGLQATVTFAERLRAIDPDEHVNGDAAELAALSEATLQQFDDDALAAVSPEQVSAMLPIIGAVYFELRT